MTEQKVDIANLAQQISDINNDKKPTRGPGKYDSKISDDKYKLCLKKYVANEPDSSLYEYSMALKKAFLQKHVAYTDTDLKEALFLGLQGDHQNAVATWIDWKGSETYQQYLDQLARDIDNTTVQEMETKFEREKQKPHEHLREYYVRFEQMWNVYVEIVRRE